MANQFDGKHVNDRVMKIKFRNASPARWSAAAPCGVRVCSGLTAVVSVKLDRPEFEGATRDRLGNRPVRACVTEAVREHLTAWLCANPTQATAVFARILTATRH
ncbi:hypothetical protein AB4225_34215 [Streptomyces sp. 2RAF24]|uniref:hypothetical protein n=1 Tax=Streptomyces sp. 2RAF24 TaxID=3232997 RepID=UPI003F994D77